MKSYKSYQKLYPHIELWKNYKGELHNENGPAVIGDDIKKWYLHGKQHREGAPAVTKEGSIYQEWWLNDEIERPDGPAMVWSCGRKEWYRKSMIHREDGPAVEWPDGSITWFFWHNVLAFDRWCYMLDKSDEEIVKLKLMYGDLKETRKHPDYDDD